MLTCYGGLPHPSYGEELVIPTVLSIRKLQAPMFDRLDRLTQIMTQILGADMGGEIFEVGPGVTKFKETV